MTTTTQKRAKVGGEKGANGEWYEGGKFINTVADNAKKRGSHKGTGCKCQMEPYVWVYQPEGWNSIYQTLAGCFGKMINGVMTPCASDVTLNYFGKTNEWAAQMCKAYNDGERFFWRGF